MTTTNTCKKCGCQDSFMPSPAPCPTPVGCPTPQPCSEIFDAQCVVYTGDPLSCTVVAQAFSAEPNPNPAPAPAGPIVNTNDTVAEALEGIVDYICNNSGEGSMTSTITCGIQDYPATVIVNSGTSYNDAIVAVSNYYCDQINNILDNPPAPEYTYEIGQYVESRGGVIFHRYKDGTTEHYLVVAKSDAATSAKWNDNIMFPLLGASSTWDGTSNFTLLSAATSSQFTSAAYAIILYNSVVPISGWYLPAVDELSLLWQNRFNVNRTLSGFSSFGSISGATQIGGNVYWSSTEITNTTAAYFSFNLTTGFNAVGKGNNYYVRAVRKFTI